jgi:GntR family transcriptional regulator
LVVALEIQIAAGGSVPLYRQIVDRVRQLRATGRLSAGAELPSVRGLAEQLVINPSTVARAYQQLLADGVIEARPGRGYFVLEPRILLSHEERRRRLADAVSQLVREATFLGFTSREIVSEVRREMDRYLNPGVRKRKP